MLAIYYVSHKAVLAPAIELNYRKIQLNLNVLLSLFPSSFVSVVVKPNGFFLYLKNNNFVNLFKQFKYWFSFSASQLMDIIIVDRLEMKLFEKKRFNYIYLLLSVFFNVRFFISGFLFLFEILPSLMMLYKSADWLEREVWDMFGIFFSGHTNLRRILTDYGFIGFPLRKDFPLTGYTELRYDEITKSIIVEPLELMQEFRFFKLEIPWRK